MSKEKHEYLAPEWSHMVEESEIGDAPEKYNLEASAEERSALARRYGVSSIESLTASIKAVRENGGAVIHLSGSFNMALTQECVVSGDPVQSEIKEDFEAWFSDPEAAVSLSKARRRRDVEVGGVEMPIMEENEDPEPIVDGKIDLGETVAQFVSLAINPYPHAEDIRYELGDDSDAALKPRAENPFAKLKDWKVRQRNEGTEQ